jgi:F0F1-type ATP synthase assembly protein I
VKPRQDGPRDGYGAGYALLTVSITFAVAVTLCLLGGLWLDRRLGVMPLFTLAGLLVGLGVGGMWAYQRIKQESGSDGAPKE